jgi:hypothetical protein
MEPVKNAARNSSKSSPFSETKDVLEGVQFWQPEISGTRVCTGQLTAGC